MLTCNAYIDGFNLYYGSVKDTPYKWLDLSRLVSLYAPGICTIKRIRYYTAIISGKSGDPDSPIRQQVYLRALRTIPNLSITFGHFLTNVVSMPVVNPKAGSKRFAAVFKTEEKGSDVNLASHLLLDAFRKDCESFLVVSNDSDLLEPIRIVRQEFGRTVGMLCPHPTPSKALAKEVDYVKVIRQGALGASQFPATLTDLTGDFTKPSTW